MTDRISEILPDAPLIDLHIGMPSLPNKVLERAEKLYVEGIHEYPLHRTKVIVDGIDLGDGTRPLAISLRDAIETLQPHVKRQLPDVADYFTPTFGVLGAHDLYVRTMQWALDTFNRLNRDYYAEANIQPLIGGMITGETTFFLFPKQIGESNLEHLCVPQSPSTHWRVEAGPLRKTIQDAHAKGVLPLGFTSISPDAPIHNIRNRKTTLALYEAAQSMNNERLEWLIRQSGGRERYQGLLKTQPAFADAIRILSRPKIFDDLVYFPVEAGEKHTCLFAEIHDVHPDVMQDVVTGISLSKIGAAGLRAGAAFVYNDALARRIGKKFELTAEGALSSSIAALTTLHPKHPLNAALRKSIRQYCDDLYSRLAYFSVLFNGRDARRILVKAMPVIGRMLGQMKNPVTDDALSYGAIPGVAVLHRDAAGYFTNLDFDMAVWGPVLDKYFPNRAAEKMSDRDAMGQLFAKGLKIELMPIMVKDRWRRDKNVLRVNCHTRFENLTAVYARLRHLAEINGLMPANDNRYANGHAARVSATASAPARAATTATTIPPPEPA